MTYEGAPPLVFHLLDEHYFGFATKLNERLH
jgi:hypothetical protein